MAIAIDVRDRDKSKPTVFVTMDTNLRIRADALGVISQTYENTQAPDPETNISVLELEVPGADVRGCAFDVADSDTIIAQARRLDADLGGIDVLVNNAGMQFRSPLTDFPLDAWRQVLNVNLTSCFVLAQELARGMLARGHGKIINVCSLQTQLVRASTSAYAAAKSGLGSLTRTMCAEWAEGGIQANGLAPGYIGTDLNTVLVEDEEFSAWVRGRTPARRWGTPEDLAGPAVWLASSASDFVNGQVIYVDGGITAVL